MEDIFKEAGLPDGVYNNLFVPGNAVGKLVSDPRIKAVSLTGSEAAGASIAAAAGANVKKSTLELGGSDPFIVLEDADLDKAVETAVYGRMWNAGQVCVSPKRIIVPESKKTEFLNKVKVIFGKLKVGNPLDADTDVAPLSSEKAAQDVEKQIQKAAQQGAKIELGGKRLDRPGAFLEPTLITGVTPDMDAFYEEIFGPVFVLYSYKTVEDAIKLANATDFGLGGTVFGKDIEKAKAVARKINTGMVYINHVFGALDGDSNLLGYCVFEPVSGDVTQIAVRKDCRRKGIGSSLLLKAVGMNAFSFIKILNTDIHCESITSFLESRNIQVTGRQFEMMRPL